jgi:hypothetical protein
VYRTDTYCRHRRIHEPRADGEEVGYTEEDEENEEHEFGVLEDEVSNNQDHSYLQTALSNVAGLSTNSMMSMGGPMGGPGMTLAAPSQLIQAQHLLQGQM